MENFLRKYGWTITLGFIALAALLLALLVNNVLASQLAPYTVPELPEVAEQDDARTTPRRRASRAAGWDTAIASKCLFGCPEAEGPAPCPGGCADGEQCQDGQCVPAEGQPSDIPSDVPVLSDLDLKLLGAMVASPADYSMALVQDGGTQQTHVLSPGDVMPQGLEIVEVRRDRLIFRRNGRLEYVRMANSISGNPLPPQATPTATLPQQATPSAKPRVNPSVVGNALGKNGPKLLPRAAGTTREVERLDDNKFKVDRSAIERELNNPKELLSQAQIVPNYSNGKRDGIKLVGVRPNSAYSKLGIRSGDVLKGVNGRDIKNQAQAVDLFEQMKNSKQVTLEIERHGQIKKMHYDIQ